MLERREGWIRRALGDAPSAPAEASVPAATPEATIAAGCELEGDLQLEGPLTVHGDLEGSIDCQQDVTIAELGTVQGPIRARSVEVRGSVVGNLEARREVVIRPGGRLHGDVSSASLVVERGACFEGRSRRIQPIAPRSEPAPSEATARPTAR